MRLEDLGLYVLGPAFSVSTAMTLLNHERPDMAILDLNLAGQVVTPVAERLYSLSVPFVLSTASDKHLIECELGKVRNLGKPFLNRNLYEALMEMMPSYVHA